MPRSVLSSLERLYDLVLWVRPDGVVGHGGSRPMPVGVFDRFDLVGEKLAERALPGPRDVLLRAWRGALEEGAWFGNLALDAPPRQFALRASRSESGDVTMLGDLITERSLHDATTDPLVQSVIDRVDIGVVIQAEDASIVMANDKACELLGLTQAQLLGRTSFDPRWRVVREDGSPFPGPEHPGPVAIRERRPIENVRMGVARPTTGDTVWLDVTAVPKLASAGTLEHVVVSFRDVTALRRALHEQKEEHALLGQVMETTVTGITVLEPTGQIIFANAAAERVLGLERSSIMQRSYDAPEWRSCAVDGSPLPDDEMPFVRVMATKAPVMDVRHAIAWPDGTRRVLSIHGAPMLDDSGAVTRLVFAMDDVTEEHARAERDARVAKRMEDIARHESLSLLAAGVAHDYNNLLVGVLGAAERAREDVPPSHPAREDLELIAHSGQRAAELTQQLLAYSGQGRFVVEPHDLRELITGNERVLAAMVSTASTLALNMPAQPLPKVRVDRGQLVQLLMNLVLNASQAMGDQGGRVAVSVREMTMDADALAGLRGMTSTCGPGRYVVLEVADDGPGVPDDIATKLLEPFFTTKAAGHGLGLAAVAGVARAHEGFVDVGSAEGGGARFRVGLPVAEDLLGSGARSTRRPTGPGAPEAAIAASTEAAAEPPATARDLVRSLPGQGPVLVCDDEHAVRRLVARILSRAGVETRLCEDGHSALDVLERDAASVRAVVLDLTMPGISGHQVLARLREVHAELPVVVISGWSDTQLSGDDPHVHFLPKPFLPQALMRSLSGALAVQ